VKSLKRIKCRELRRRVTLRVRNEEAVRDEEAVRQLVERLALVFADWGFPRMAGRVLFALMTADEPSLTATELAERLEVSPAAISGAVRYLVQIDLVRREGVPGSRRDRYRLPDEAWYAAAATKGTFYGVIISTIDDVLDALGGPDTPARARVTEMRDFFDFVRAEMPSLLDRWQATRAAGATGANGVRASGR
jgi:DNA-binding transcriptional ArsR family regulator